MDRKDIVYSEIILPDGLAEDPNMEWARDRAKLWNAAEKAGARRNSRLGREVLVILPPEINAAKRTELARRFAVELAAKYRGAVDFAVHEPRAGSDQRHHHAHLLMTTREVNPKGLGSRTILDLSGTERRARGLGPSKTDLLWIRERWAELTNGALKEAGIGDRVDHRSYWLQGLDRDPAVALPQKVFYAEREHGRTSAGDAIRARHRERAEARVKGGNALELVLRKQRLLKSQAMHEINKRPKTLRYGALRRDEINQLRRQRYRGSKDEINERRRQSERELVRADDNTLKSRLELRRERYREQFQAMTDTKREKMREQARLNYHKRVALKKERELSAAHSPTHETTPGDDLRDYKEYRRTHGPGPTEDEALENYKAYREAQSRSDENSREDDRSKTDHGMDHGL